MTFTNESKVALLVDFENLVYSLVNKHGEAYADKVDPEILMRVSEDQGQVILANVYADWRSRDLNQFQTDLYRLGMDLVHVLGRRQGNTMKNAVDVKMAVDAIEIMWKYQHIDTFVIVSGDRDFIHVLKTLRRNGKTIVGISPDGSTSADFAGLCDRFIRYDSLYSTLATSQAPAPVEAASPQSVSISRIKEILINALVQRPSGLKGSQLKPLIRRLVSPTFDESEFGYSRMLDFLMSLGDGIEIVTTPGEDYTVLLAGAISNVTTTPSTPIPIPLSEPGLRAFKIDARLGEYHFETDQGIRRAILKDLFDVISDLKRFSINSAIKEVQLRGFGQEVSVKSLIQYLTVLWQSKTFIVEQGFDDQPARDRMMTIVQGVRSRDIFIQRYEVAVVFKLLVAADKHRDMIDPPMVSELMGLSKEAESIEYATELIKLAMISIRP